MSAHDRPRVLRRSRREASRRKIDGIPWTALTGQAIGDFAKSVWAAYPDASLEIISRGDTGGGLVATQLIIHGTHTGPFMDGTPPTGRTVAYPGASFVQVEGDKIRSQHDYLDRQTVAELLGLKAK